MPSRPAKTMDADNTKSFPSHTSGNPSRKKKLSYFKMSYEDDTRRLPMSALGSQTYEDLMALIRTTFGTLHPYKVRYRDDEGDLVDISKDHELKEALSISESEGNTLKLFIECKDDASTATPSFRADRERDPSVDLSNLSIDQSDTLSGINGPSIDVASQCSEKSDRKRGRRRNAHRKERNAKDSELLKQSVKESVRKFFGEEKVVKAIQDSVPLFIKCMLDGKGFQVSLETAVKSQPYLKNHEFVNQAMPMMRTFLGMFPTGMCLGGMMLELVPKFQGIVNGATSKAHRGLKAFRDIIGTVRSVGKEYYKSCCSGYDKKISNTEQKSLGVGSGPWCSSGAGGISTGVRAGSRAGAGAGTGAGAGAGAAVGGNMIGKFPGTLPTTKQPYIVPPVLLKSNIQAPQCFATPVYNPASHIHSLNPRPSQNVQIASPHSGHFSNHWNLPATPPSFTSHLSQVAPGSNISSPHGCQIGSQIPPLHPHNPSHYHQHHSHHQHQHLKGPQRPNNHVRHVKYWANKNFNSSVSSPHPSRKYARQLQELQRLGYRQPVDHLIHVLEAANGDVQQAILFMK
ncbi:hypothetical protein AAMO2058_000610000 [Amorphochlora amoebiformis]